VLDVTVLDVGQGDCIFVRTPAGHTILIDSGGHSDSLQDQSSSDVGLDTVLPFLRYRGINRIDMAVVTHPHGDHVGGFPAVFRALPVGVVLDGTTVPYDATSYKECLAVIRAKKIRYVHATRGMRIDFHDGVAAWILNPPADTRYGTDDGDRTINNYSVVMRLTYGSTAFMLDGDAETDAEDDMLKYAAGADLRSDVLKCGHHGSRNASSDEWLAAVRPVVGIISCGRHNVFGHPHGEALDRLGTHGVRILRTDQNGAVECSSDGRHVTVHCTINSTVANSLVAG
jgi:beta-lactamase superfamily II metal-dependent hydrolase